MKSRKPSTRICFALLAALLTGGAPDTAEAKKKPKRGVFGKIHGKAFNATNLQGATDPCVRGSYRPSNGILILQALECRPKRRRQGATRRNYKILIISCINPISASNPLTPPFEIPCGSSVYEENKTGRFGLSVAKSQWVAETTFLPGGILTSTLRVRVDAIEGENIRGALSGSFDQALAPATGTAAIDGEVQFAFPFELK